MFIAYDDNGGRINSLTEDEDVLFRKAKNNLVFCPECNNHLKFRSGTFKPHFYHPKHSNCTYPYGEPESETHIKGKTLLFEWLQSLYPDSKVHFEWKIEETNQRSDVIVIHENGERWAFEFQCSPIPERVWNERHSLYEQAGVRDIWIMSNNLNKYIYDENKNFRLSRDIEKAIYKSNHLIYYLDVQQNVYNIVRGGEFETKTKLKEADYFFNSPMLENEFRGHELWNKTMLQYYADDFLIEKLSNNETLYRIVSDELQKIHLEKQRIKIKQLNDHYKSLAYARNRSFKQLSIQEKNLLDHLCQKHQYTLKTMPGFFFCKISTRIKTPSFLIQLWLYDQVLYKITNQSSLRPPDLMKYLFELKRQRVYRVYNQNRWLSKKSDMLFIDCTMFIWRKIGIIKRSRDNFNHTIQCNYLPPHRWMKESVFIEWFSSSKEIKSLPTEVLESYLEYRDTLRLQ